MFLCRLFSVGLPEWLSPGIFSSEAVRRAVFRRANTFMGEYIWRNHLNLGIAPYEALRAAMVKMPKTDRFACGHYLE